MITAAAVVAADAAADDDKHLCFNMTREVSVTMVMKNIQSGIAITIHITVATLRWLFSLADYICEMFSLHDENSYKNLVIVRLNKDFRLVIMGYSIRRYMYLELPWLMQRLVD